MWELCTFGPHVKFLLYFSRAAKPINATEDYIKSHSKTFKYIVLGILGAGNTKHLLTCAQLLQSIAVYPANATCLLCLWSNSNMEMDSKTRFLEDTLSLVLCRLCGILHCSLCTGFPEGPCTCGPNMFGRCRCGLRSCEWALGRKSQQGIQTCCQSLQAPL